MKETKEHLRRGRGFRGHAWLALVLVLLLSLLATSALAQDDEGGLQFLVEEGPEAVEAPASSVWIPVTRDAFVASNQPNTNYGFDPFVRFGFVPNGLGAMRPLFFFDLRPSIPRQARITRAELHIFLASVQPGNDSGRGYAAHYLAQSWQENTVTWNRMPQWGAEFARTTAATNTGWQVINVTNLVREWQGNPGGNNGVILIGDERPDQNHERAYFSKDANNGLFPRLYVEFDASVDTTPPTATVTRPTPPGVWSGPSFIVRWDGSDPNNPDGSPGSGIRWFDGYYSLDGGNRWIIGRAQVTTRETQVIGAQHLQRIDFYVRARDNAGNEGPAPTNPSFSQTWTRVDAQPPNATMNPLPEFTAASSFQVSWGDTREVNESGLRSYDVQWRADGGPWNTLAYNTTATSTTFIGGENGVLYEFRARGTDNVGNVQGWGDPQAFTIVWLEPVAFVLPFDPFVYQKLNGPEAGDGFNVAWEALTPPGTSIASFDVRYRRPNSNTWISWLSGTRQTSARFDLEPGDPDGTYVFQVRATSTGGVTGQFYEELEERIVVDRNEPFIVPQSYMPLLAEE